jgi:hypothetical protein
MRPRHRRRHRVASALTLHGAGEIGASTGRWTPYSRTPGGSANSGCAARNARAAATVRSHS